MVAQLHKYTLKIIKMYILNGWIVSHVNCLNRDVVFKKKKQKNLNQILSLPWLKPSTALQIRSKTPYCDLQGNTWSCLHNLPLSPGLTIHQKTWSSLHPSNTSRNPSSGPFELFLCLGHPSLWSLHGWFLQFPPGRSSKATRGGVSNVSNTETHVNCVASPRSVFFIAIVATGT